MEDLNPNHLQDQYPDEILQSVYWSHRGQYQVKDNIENVGEAIEKAARIISKADALIFVTGAGAGVDMGLPDFRSSNAFWEQLAHPEISRYEDFSDNKWFEKDPALAWGVNYYQLAMYRCARVHEGYEVMLRLAHMKNNNYFCFTTNIDGVLNRAGFDSSRVREVHGNIHRLQCTQYDCKDERGERDAWENHLPIELRYSASTYRATSSLPQCRNCGGLARPNVWFCKDTQYVLHKASSKICDAYFDWLNFVETKQQKAVVIEVGAGLVIPSARVEAEDVAERLQGVLIRINPVDYAVPVEQAIGIPLGAAEGLVRIFDKVQQCHTAASAASKC